jgi:ATP-dependent Clp protease ATP-binding subunit ClpC
MFERYSERARRVIYWARYEVGQSASDRIEPQHLLLGILGERPDLIPQCSEIKKEIKLQVGRNTQNSKKEEVPLSQASWRVLKRAEEEADELGHRRIGTEHILAAIFYEESPTSEVLRAQGVNLPAPTEDRSREPGTV